MKVIDDSCVPSSTPCKHNQEMVVDGEPGDLLEKSWFFGNLLDRKTAKMFRCYSDPCSSSSSFTDADMLVGKSYEETYSSLKKLPQEDNSAFPPPGLIKRTPSLPEESTYQSKEVTSFDAMHPGGSKSSLKKSNCNLLRAPSLPTSLSREENYDEESDFSMSKLIRQASLKQSDLMLPPRRIPKSTTQNSSTPRHRPRKKTDSERCKSESPEGVMIRRQGPLHQTKSLKSSSEFIQELQGFKDLSIKFDSQDLGSGLQEKQQQQQQFTPQSEGKLRRSYSTSNQAWQTENSASPMGKKSAEDMKAQIRFWARAVASNVRQEC